MAFRSQGGLLAPTCGSEETEVGAFVCHDILTSNHFGRSERLAPHWLFKFFACFRRQSVDAVAFNQPLKSIAAAATAFLELNVEHLELAASSRKMMAPSRGISQPVFSAQSHLEGARSFDNI
jgi:hypothetical protein